MLLIVHADFTYSRVYYYITPSPNVTCPQNLCITLSQFAANFSSYHSKNTNLFLIFISGNHILDIELSVAYADNFTMAVDAQDNELVFVECTNQTGRFDISETTFASIKGLHFIGCGDNTVTQVDQFILEDVIFQDAKGRGPALVLNVVAAASIMKSSFLSNTNGNRSEHHINITAFEDVLNSEYFSSMFSTNLTYGGALYTAYSNVMIDNTKFDRNSAPMGTAISVFDGSISISNSQFVNNHATSAFSRYFNFGAILLFDSYALIDSSKFIHNIASVGGVLVVVHSSSLHIARSTFSYNRASYGGVIATSDSLFSITNSTFSNNSAAECGGVIYSNYVSSFNTTSSIFINNGAAVDGGVMCIDGSSFDITSSTFTNSGANDSGGVMYLSLIHI